MEVGHLIVVVNALWVLVDGLMVVGIGGRVDGGGGFDTTGDFTTEREEK